MPSSYSNNGLELIAPGEQSNTWGDTTNDNLNLLDEAIDGVVTITSSSTTQTLTAANGVSSNGRHKVISYAGTPAGTVTVTITPNTLQKLYFVKNNYAQSIVFTQGSGGNVTLTAGKTAILFCDGAGATAKVTEFASTLQLAGSSVTNTPAGGVVATDVQAAINELDADLTAHVHTASVVTNAPAGNIAATNVQAAINELDADLTAHVHTASVVTNTPAGNITATNVQAAINELDTEKEPADITILKNASIGVTVAPLASPALTGTPTAPTPSAVDSTTKIATTAFVQAVSAGIGIGVGQTWQDVKASRALNVIYTNSTGKPIMVSVYAIGSPNSCQLGVYINEVKVASQGVVSVASAAMRATLTYIIPNGDTYRFVNENGASVSLWWELR